MNATQLLAHLTERQIDRLFEIARTFPEDKLDWKPGPNARSVLDQLQEVSTLLGQFGSSISERKFEWDEGKMALWMEERSKLTTLDELERTCKEQTALLTEHLKTVPEADLDLPFEMPFPGDFTYADILANHYWNATYHEGQIMYIKSLLP